MIITVFPDYQSHVYPVGRIGLGQALIADTIPKTAITPRKYAIELRDRFFRLKGRLEPYVTSARWEWNRAGGCGRASLKVQGDYLRYQINANDDIRIYLPDMTGSNATLVYRGYVENPTSMLSNDESISIECAGYFDWLDRIVVHNSNEEVTYSGIEVSQIVSDIVTDYILPDSPITLGTVEASAFAPDSISFKASVKDVLKTLADLIGRVEFGVDANLNFFWRNQSQSITSKIIIGDHVTKLSDRVDFRNIINEVLFEGGTVNDAVFKTSGRSLSSQARYGKHQSILSSGSISTSHTANQYISGTLKQKGRPIRQMSVSLKNTKKRYETTQPMGAIAIIDSDFTQQAAIYGTTASGGSNKIYGAKNVGGSGQLYGGSRREQIDRIQYNLIPEDGRYDAEIQFGDSLAVSLASARLKQIEETQSALRQRSL